MLTHSFFFIKHDCGKLKELSVKNYYWIQCQHNRAWFGTQLGEGSVVTNIYLLWWSMVKVRNCALSLII